jgi:hypothetical protein
MPPPVRAAFNALVGSWQVEGEISQPEGEPLRVSGTALRTWILDRRCVRQDFRMESQGRVYEGLRFLAYDAARGQVQSVWLDNRDGVLHASAGGYDPSTQRFELYGERLDDGGAPMRTRTVTQLITEDLHSFERFDQGADGAWNRILRLVYTRRPR